MASMAGMKLKRFKLRYFPPAVILQASEPQSIPCLNPTRPGLPSARSMKSKVPRVTDRLTCSSLFKLLNLSYIVVCFTAQGQVSLCLDP